MTDDEISATLVSIQQQATKLADEIYGRTFGHGARPALAKAIQQIQDAVRSARCLRIPQTEGEITADQCRQAIEAARQEYADSLSKEAFEILDRTKAMARQRYPDEFK